MNLKKNTVKIPSNISLIYCNKKKLIVFLGPENKKKILKLKLKIIIFKNLIRVTLLPFLKGSNTEKKSLKSMRGTTLSLIKQMIIEVSTTMYQKLKLVGIGYRIINIETFGNKLIQIKTGFSHPVFYGITKTIKCFCKKQTQLFILTNSYQHSTQIAAFIRDIKKPDPYKGKGILYANETVKIKKGKKI